MPSVASRSRGLRPGPVARPAVAGPELPVRDAGSPAGGDRVRESALEAARLSASAHELYRALFELGWTLYYAGDLDGALAAHEESSRVDPRLAGARSRTAAAARAGASVSRGSSRARSNAAEPCCSSSVENVARTMPVERCFDWESLTLAELAVGDVDAADAYARRAEQDAAQLALKLPSALAGRARAAVLLARGEPLEAARVAHDPAEAAGSVGATSRRRSPAGWRDVRW